MALFAASTSALGVARESTRGTAVSAAYWIPTEIAPKWTPKIQWLADKHLRGAPVEQYDVIPGPYNQEFSAKTAMYVDTFPVWAEMILGGTDTVTGTTAPYTHSIPLKQTTDTQPSSWTFHSYDGQATRRITQTMLSKMDLNFAADSTVDVDLTFVGAGETDQSQGSPSFTTQPMAPGWNSSLTVLSGTTSQTANVMSGQLTIDRKVVPIFTIGTQTPLFVWADSISVSGKITIVQETGDLTLTDALTRLHNTWVLTLTDPVTSYYSKFTMSSVQLEDPQIDQGKSYLCLDTNFTALGNSTDGSPYSPITYSGTNAQSTAFSA